MPEKTVFIGVLCTCRCKMRQLDLAAVEASGRHVMRLRGLVKVLGAAALGLALQACVVRDTTPVNPGYAYGYGYGPQVQAGVTVSTPSPYAVSSMPPEPLYRSMS